MQKYLKEDLVSGLKPIREWIKNIPKAITFRQFPSITAYDYDGEEAEDVFVWDIAEQYLRKFASKSGTDKTFLDCGIRMVSFTLVTSKQK